MVRGNNPTLLKWKLLTGSAALPDTLPEGFVSSSRTETGISCLLGKTTTLGNHLLNALVSVTVNNTLLAKADL